MQSGIHVTGKFKTKYMQEYIFKVRPDGLCVLDIQKINEKLNVASKFISRYEPDKIIVICRRDVGFKAAKKFAEIIGAKAITSRYLPGTFTNPIYEKGYMEPKLLIVCDPWTDRQAIRDALKIGIPIVALCDSSNLTANIDMIIPCNNKAKKALGLIFWILAREYLKNRKIISDDKEFKHDLNEMG